MAKYYTRITLKRMAELLDLPAEVSITTALWLQYYFKELHSLYCSPNIVKVIKSRRLRWAGNVARMEEDRSAFRK